MADEFVRDILGYPENYKLLAILTVGVPNEEKDTYELDKLPVEKIHRERFKKIEIMLIKKYLKIKSIWYVIL